MMRSKRMVSATVALAAAAASIVAQEQESPTIRSEVREVIAPTTVLDKDGAYISGIKASEFRLFDNDKLQQIKVDEIYAPISLVVAVQSDSKVEAVLPKLRRVGTMLQTLVAGEGGEVAILAFDHRMLQLTNGFTTDSAVIDQAMQKLKPGSNNAALTDAVVEATRMLRNRPKDRRRVLLLIAESLDKGSTLKAREALTNLEINNVMVYALNISRFYANLTAKPGYPRPDPIPTTARPMPAGGAVTPTETARLYGRGGMTADFAPLVTELMRGVKAIFVPNPVEVYTKYSGGKEFGFVSQEDLERAVQAVGREIHNQYLITYNPNNKLEGGYHRIRVEVSGLGRSGLEVRTRPGYWMAATQ